MRLCWHEARARNILTEARVDSPGLCARILTAFAAGLNRNIYPGHRDEELAPEREALLYTLVARRAAGEPLAYILGKKEFFEHEFLVSADVLVPRPETELVVELALAMLPASPLNFIDFGCGSGCIGLSLLAARPAWQGILLEKSLPALAIAAANARLVAPRAAIMAGDLFAPPFQAACADLIVSNPPYIAIDDEIMPEVAAYEPALALFSAKSGLMHIRALARFASIILRDGGLLIFEHGSRQGVSAANIPGMFAFEDIKAHNDLAGLPRCISARKKSRA